MDEGVLQAVRALVDKYRATCLWFLDETFYPETEEQVMRVLGWIQRYGTRAAYIEAAEVREWLSQSSNVTSSG